MFTGSCVHFKRLASIQLMMDLDETLQILIV